MHEQSVVLAVAVAFVVLLAGMTISVVAESGFDFLTVLSILILAIIGFGVIGALLDNSRDE
jgi:hypothetical protein